MKLYYWYEEGTFWPIPYFGWSWKPCRPDALFFGWLVWTVAIYFHNTDRKGSFVHTHQGKVAA